MLDVTAEALRVSRGLVLWVCAGVTRDRNYWPACEGLKWEGWKRGFLCECPAFWHRSGVAGSGGDQWLRKDVEYVLAFKSVAALPWSDNTACGSEPKWQPGGPMSNRRVNGERVKAEGRKTLVAEGVGRNIKTRETKTGEVRVFNYIPPDIVNPGNYLEAEDDSAELLSSVVHVPVGGGKLGNPIAHENEAPFPEALAEFFVKSFCPPGGTVLDPFSGSGTTAAVADRLGRHGLGFDLRASQSKLGTRRLTRPHAPVIKASAPEKPMPLFEAV
jgi:hypothetical protein